MFERFFQRARGRAPDAKASAAGPVIALQHGGRARWTPRDYASLAREGFVKNPVAYRAVRMIAEAAASVPFLLYEGEAELTQHPLLDLLAAPNPAEARGDLLERLYAGLQIAGNAYVEAVRLVRTETPALPGVAKASFIDALDEYGLAAVEARLNGAESAKVAQVQLAMVLGKSEAAAIAARTLQEAWAAREGASFALPLSKLALECGDAVRLTVDGQPRVFRLTQVAEQGRRLVEAGRLVRHLYEAPEARLDGTARPPLPAFGPPALALLDLAPIAFQAEGEGLYLAAFAEPWPGAVTVLRAVAGDEGFTPLVEVTHRAVMGETVSDLARGPVGVWDRVNHVDLLLFSGALSAASERAVLDGANRAALEVAAGVWEAIQFASAELVAPQTWRLSMLLRGQAGTAERMADALAAGARFVLLDGAVVRSPITPDEAGALTLKAGPSALPLDDIAWVALTADYDGFGRLPWSVCDLCAVRHDSGDIAVTWARRARDDAGRWNDAEVGLGEEAERYRVEILDGGEVVRSADCAAPSFVYTAAMQMADWSGAPTSPLTLRVTQISPRFGPGTPRTATLSF
jgi:hypothetical protein